MAMLERLDSEAQAVIRNAENMAVEVGQASVDAEHLLLALLKTGSVRHLLLNLQMEPDEISKKLLEIIKHDDRRPQTRGVLLPSPSPRLHRILELAWQEATLLKQETISETHLLLGMIIEGRSSAVRVLAGTKDTATEDLLKGLYASLGDSSDKAGNSELAQAYYGRLYARDPADARIPRAYLDILKGLRKEEKSAVSRFDQYSIIEESEVIEEPAVTFDAVAGIDNPDSEYYRIRRIFELVFLYPEQYRELASEYGVATTGTLLLFGPTGVGKTFISRAMAGEFSRRTGKKLTFINARLSSVLDKWVGNTEKNITRLVEIAIERSPSLLLLDEIDSLGMERASVGARDYRIDWVNHLLLELDRLKNSRKPALVVACTNSIAHVDLALRRRLGTPIIIPMPDQAVRAQVFRLYVEKVSPSVRDVIDYGALAEATVGFTPSDIEEIVQETINRVWLEIVDALTSTETARKRQLCTGDFFTTLKNKTPSVPISRWVRESIEHLRATGDENLAQRVMQAFKGYYTTDEFYSLMRPASPQKWFVQKV